MPSKLEKAQDQYEKLLLDLAQKAQLLELMNQLTPSVRQKYERALEALSDRQTELDFLTSQVAELDQEHARRLQELKEQTEKLREELHTKEQIVGVKEDKAAPYRKKLAGAEYDIKFVQKAYKLEQDRYQHALKVQDHDRAKVHEANIKRMKIDLMKRERQIEELKRQIEKYKNPSQQIEEEIEQLRGQLKALEQEQKQLRQSGPGPERDELEEQRQAKEAEVKRAELLVQDALADAGEDFYRRRLPHPVLEKLYTEIDGVAQFIDQLQKEK